MIDLLNGLERRRLALQSRCDMQRAQITQRAAALVQRGVVFERAVVLGRSISTRPVILGAIAALTVAFGPRKLLSWAVRGSAIYGLIRRVLSVVGTYTR